MREELRNKLKPLYDELIGKASKGDCAFCVQWGCKFPDETNDGILFVGRAVNSWISDVLDVDYLFCETNDNRIFNCHNQIKWVEENRGKEYGEYNTNKSAFWRVIKQTTKRLYPSGRWYEKIAWSNLCKLSPYKGLNPTDSSFFKQLEVNKRILDVELTVLSPKVIVFLTKHNWAKYYFPELLNKTSSPIKSVAWCKYKSHLYKINNQYIIISEHPMGKKEKAHIDALVELIKHINIIIATPLSDKATNWLPK